MTAADWWGEDRHMLRPRPESDQPDEPEFYQRVTYSQAEDGTIIRTLGEKIPNPRLRVIQ